VRWRVNRNKAIHGTPGGSEEIALSSAGLMALSVRWIKTGLCLSTIDGRSFVTFPWAQEHRGSLRLSPDRKSTDSSNSRSKRCREGGGRGQGSSPSGRESVIRHRVIRDAIVIFVASPGSAEGALLLGPCHKMVNKPLERIFATLAFAPRSDKSHHREPGSKTGEFSSQGTALAKVDKADSNNSAETRSLSHSLLPGTRIVFS